MAMLCAAAMLLCAPVAWAESPMLFDPLGSSPPRTAARQTQFSLNDPPGGAAVMPAGVRRIRAFPRTAAPVQAQWFRSSTRDEWVAVISSGVNLIVDSGTAGTIDISTDRVVIWTGGSDEPDLTGELLQGEQTPLEIYMEGNIVFRQGDRFVHADRMYYNVRMQTGIVLDAQLFAPVPEYAGIARIKADVVQQLDRDRFVARNAAVTTSRLGIPGYWLQTGTVTYQNIQSPLVQPLTGQPVIDPLTGQPRIHQEHQVTGSGNTIYLEGLPVFYWPRIETDLSRPTYLINSIAVRSDNLFGNQIYTNWDMYQLFGIANPPDGTEWALSADYLDRRGPAGGSRFAYDRGTILGAPTPHRGFADAWVIKDHGLDNLGRDRRAVELEESFRGRALWRHQQQLPSNLRLQGEFGWISDRNFLEQYFEREWDEEKDQVTRLELSQPINNSSWSVSGSTRINEFFTETEWLPRADHYWIGQTLFDRFTWYEHTSLGYARLREGSAPTNPTDLAKWEPLAWEGDFEGGRFLTRQELNLPFSLGPTKVVPYALGELGHWGSDMDGDKIDRAYGQAGVRASLPMWTANPHVRSELFYLNGLAHKIVFDVDFYWAESNRDLDEFPLYDQLDDNSVQHFRRRFFFDTFGLMPGDQLPMRFDERHYALRRGMASWVTAPSMEIADDMMAMRFGARQRWQTKRGAPGNERIIDWITLDTRAVWFPRAGRDNFGESFGLMEYDFRWHVGDRVTLVSDGIFDTFNDGQRFVSVGGFLHRPPNASWYAGFRSLEGPINANVLTSSYSYRLGPKWIVAFGSSYDLSEAGNIGQSFRLTRVGESMLVRLGMNVDATRNTIGAQIAIEPRFMPRMRTHDLTGAQVLPPGPFELE